MEKENREPWRKGRPWLAEAGHKGPGTSDGEESRRSPVPNGKGGRDGRAEAEAA